MSLSVWEPMISADNDGNLQPCLAVSWESNEDATEWTFHLREGVTFHDGEPFNADAVLANLDRHKAASDERFAVTDAKSLVTHYAIFNGSKATFDDVRVRQAVSMVINRDEIVNDLYAGFGGVPTVNILNFSSPYAEDFEITYDVEKAKELVKEALGDEEYTIDIVTSTSMANRYPYKEEAELMQNVRSELDPEKRNEMYDRLQEIGTEDLPAAPILNVQNYVLYNQKVVKNYQATNEGVDLPAIEWVE